MVLTRRTWVTGLFATFSVIGFVIFILHVMNERSDMAAEKNVKTVLGLTHASINKWLEVNKNITAYYADTAFVRRETTALLEKNIQPQALLQQNIRNWFQEIRDKYHYLGYFIIDRKGINLASSRDTNLSVPSLLLGDEGLLESVFAGKVMNSIPLKTDVPIIIDGQEKANVYSVFTVAPVYDENKNVIAAFAFRINPGAELSYFIDIAAAENAVKVIPVTRQFKRVYLRAEEDAIENFPTEVEAEVTHLLQSEELLPEHSVLLTNNTHEYLIGAVLWDYHIGMGFFAYVDHAEAHAAYSNATIAIILLATIVVLLLWLALLGLDKSQLHLKNANRWLENLLNAIPSIICVIDKKGDLKFGNKNLYILEGYRNKIASDEFLQIDNWKSGHWCLYDSILERAWGPWCVKYISPEGHEKIINFEHIKIEDERGLPVDLVVANDATDYMQIESEKSALRQQLQQAQKMEAIGQLTGGIAHDFNNMLSAILGYTQLSLDYFTDGNQKLKDYLSEVNSAGQRAQKMIQQMLAYSRSDGKTNQKLDPEPVLKESFRLLKSTIPSSIELVEKITQQSTEIIIDPIQLQQIIMNLVINSRDAIHNKGIIVCSLEESYKEAAICSSCHESFSGQYVAIAVQDTGEGIDAKELSKIFEPFYTSKEVGKGSGMGLSMVHGIVHSANGHILVNSKPGLGTEIVLLFPQIEKKEEDVGQKTA